jgi:hypothetical protein
MTNKNLTPVELLNNFIDVQKVKPQEARKLKKVKPQKDLILRKSVFLPENTHLGRMKVKN